MFIPFLGPPFLSPECSFSCFQTPFPEIIFHMVADYHSENTGLLKVFYHLKLMASPLPIEVNALQYSVRSSSDWHLLTLIALWLITNSQVPGTMLQVYL